MSKRSASFKERNKFNTVAMLTEQSTELGVWLVTETGVNCRLSSTEGCLYVEDSHRDALENLSLRLAN